MKTLGLFTAGILAAGFIMGADIKLKEGDAAPDFSLMDQNGNLHSLSDYRGQKVVVYFYPKNDTPGCTKEACSFRDDYSLFQKDSIKVFGISYDSSESHRKFAEKYRLPFTLLSDSEKTVARAYGSKGLIFPKRKTFLIDEMGMVLKVYHEMDVTTHGAQILADFEAMDAPVDPEK